MDETANLKLPYILAAQSQKHVTHNEALRALDALVQLAVLDKDLTAPPGSPAEGARYIVAASPTGGWSGQAGKIAAYRDGAWGFHTPFEGWLAWVADEDTLYVFNGTSWIPNPAGGGGAVNPVSLVGVNATADATNRLSVSSPASLFNHEGAGHQVKINKASAAHTGSVLFQTGFSGRAEFGLTGDDDFHVKVSPNGSGWTEALLINKSSGAVGGTGFALGVRGQLLGTVSQSGGVPTGAVIERGSNANGDYVRLADGTQWCWASGISMNITTAMGSLFRGFATWTFPAAFVSGSSPFISSTVMDAIVDCYGSNSGAPSTVSTTLRTWGATSRSGVLCGGFAVGKWF